MKKRILSKARKLKALGIPKEDRRDLIRMSTGFLPHILGISYIMNDIIDDAEKYNLRGREALNYIRESIPSGENEGLESSSNFTEY